MSSVEAEVFLGKGVKYLLLWVILEHKRLRSKWFLESEEYAWNQWFCMAGCIIQGRQAFLPCYASTPLLPSFSHKPSL